MNGRILTLLIFSVIIYSNSLFNSFVWVDHTQILQKEHIIQDLDGLVNTFTKGMPGFSASIKGGYYRPIINLSYSIDYWIWGLTPFGFHLTNVLAHTLTGIILYLILLKMLEHEYAAFFASLLFLAHPIHTEAVAWVSGRADMFFTLFYLLSLLFYIRTSASGQKTSSARKSYLLSGSFFLLALQSKEMAITFPLVIILYDVCFRVRDKSFSLYHNIRSYIFYFGILAGYLIFRLSILGGVGSGQTIPGNSIIISIYTTSRIFVEYIWKLIFPVNLAVSDVDRLAYTIMHTTVIGSLILLLLLIIAAILFYRSQPVLTFGILWFFITLIPVSNIVPALHLKAERFLYLPSIGFCIIIASILWGLNNMLREQLNASKKWAVLAVALIILSIYGLITFDRNFDWKDDLTIFSDAIKKSPYTREAYAELGVTYREMQRYKEAETAFLSALKERKGYKAFVQPHAMHQNLAEIYFITGQAVKSIDHLLWLGRHNRNSYEVQRDLGLAYLKIGRPDWALVKLRQALLTAPREPKLMEVFQRAIKFAETAPVTPEGIELQVWLNKEMAHYDLGIAYMQLKEYPSAIKEFSAVITINPSSPEAHAGIARANRELGQ